MERLTGIKNSLHQLIKTFVTHNGINKDTLVAAHRELYNQLSEYEDTNLTPAEIEALKAENERLKAERDAAVSDIKKINGSTSPCHICKYVDMIRCCHHELCGIRNNYFTWRGLDNSHAE